MNERVTQFGRRLISHPLERHELLKIAVGLWVSGIAYCALYCRIAYYPMHHGGMPLWKSVWWSGTTLVPWFLVFEAVKRVLPLVRHGRMRILACVAIAAATIALTVSAYRLADVTLMGVDPKRLPTLIASQLQPALLFALLVILWAAHRSRPTDLDSNMRGNELPPLAEIDWIRSAGNYVEVRCGDRLLIRRMTMRRAEHATHSADFVRIHRSMIVRRPLIRGYSGRSRSHLLLGTGETMPIGDSYRRDVERLVSVGSA